MKSQAFISKTRGQRPLLSVVEGLGGSVPEMEASVTLAGCGRRKEPPLAAV